ncbi:Translation initiation factor IF-3 [Buchnera aphidicola (Cinara kochiana kochiana)]|uniref:Translation initiation factor IF-3 n=1 Tax=Buchnera aphidicola (Cinara kochiana kochiana) TaxID=2518976 RepID=A0A451D5M3_9GAMM|nr:translation initiation factor IF-3 [Buchnera aphidicola]VFP81004.1 Translation initiation factor IF-3 [Buchnera aphidicola (Cinara kochiana kochiana)]
MKVGKKNQLSRSYRVNQEIHSIEVRLMGLKGEQLGIVSIDKALEQAEIYGFDLVEISPNSKPPVCRIMNYGKFLYEKNKALKKQKKKQKIVQIKEIKFRPNTDEGDYQVKLRNLIRFLKDGNKVKITLRFRGREMAHQSIGINMLNRLKDDLSTLTCVEYFPKRIEGRQMIMMLSPKK